MTDPVQSILAYNAGREPERLSLKYRNLREDPFVFMRGACHLFYERLQASPPPAAPLAQICGDLHLENFGSYKGDSRLTYFDLNDFDESVLAPATWDLVRLAASLLVGAETIKVDARQAHDLCRDLVRAYAEALADGKPRWIERETATGLIKSLLDNLRKRRRAELLADWTVQGKQRPTIKLRRKHALEASEEDKQRARDLVGRYAASRRDPRFFDVLDVARRVAGTGSLGLERYVVLVRGKGSRDGHYLLDVKQAIPSSLEERVGHPQPGFESAAGRIVAVQRRMQAVSTAFLHPVQGEERSYVIRGLQPQEDKVRLDGSKAKFQRICGVLEDMGRLAAWAHLRSAGRQGSAAADELIAFAQTQSAWGTELVKAARQCATQVVHDWKAYAKAYDKGAFAP
jgi:uncharacterized protein (DUF2252 family)